LVGPFRLGQRFRSLAFESLLGLDAHVQSSSQ
jgi:hypothetical protein